MIKDRNEKGKFIKGHSLGKRFQKGEVSAFKGRNMSIESKKKLSSAHMGKVPWNKGKKRPEMSGEKNWNWKGGNSPKTRRDYAPYSKPDQCEICGAFDKDFKKGLCLDHDHKTGKFRGWLCFRCNVVLGFVKDNSETLLALSDYLINRKNI